MPHPAQETLDLLNEGVLVVDAGGHLTFANDFARRVFGFPSGPCRLEEAVGEAPPEPWRRVLERARTEGVFHADVAGPRSRDGEAISVCATATLDGGALLELRPRPRRPEDEELLDAYARVLARHRVGLWRLDATSGELWWSPECYELMGMPPGPVSTEAYLERVHPDDQLVIGEQMSAAVTGAGEYAPCFRVEHARGVRHLRDRGEIVRRSENGQLELAIGATIDRTPLVELEERCAALEARLIEAERLNDAGRLAGAVAHDLNNVMTVVVGNTELLGDAALEGRDKEMLLDILTAGQHASALAGRMLDFVRKAPLAPATLEMASFVQRAAPILRSMVPDSVTVDVRLPERPLFCRGDHHRLEQVLFNLVLNAAEAIGSRGRITVAVTESAQAGAVTLSVEDNGRGMSAEHLERIFEPFFSTRTGGAGLGLASVRAVVQQHGGQIDCVSTLGEGSRFEVTLPGAGEPADPVGALRGPPTAADRLVWIVEDQRLVRIVAERLLSGAGYRIRAFPDATRLLSEMAAAAPEDLPELVLSDVVMPRMTGPELEGELARSWSAVNLLFMTGYADDLLAPYLGQLGTRRLLRKPFTRDQLLRAVEEALDPLAPQVGEGSA